MERGIKFKIQYCSMKRTESGAPQRKGLFNFYRKFYENSLMRRAPVVISTYCTEQNKKKETRSWKNPSSGKRTRVSRTQKANISRCLIKNYYLKGVMRVSKELHT